VAHPSSDIAQPNPRLTAKRYVPRPRANPVPHPHYMQRLPGKQSPANPELMVAHRFTADTPKMTDATFLAANPEIMAYQRYVAATAGQQ
jgi:hypothetical protein